MRYTEIRVKNYQPLADIQLELGPVTVLRGESDIGKSSVIRAIEDMLTGVMSKDDIRYGQKEAEITIVTTEGTVRMVRPFSGSAYYEVTPKGGATVKHSGCNRSVPPEVSAALGIEPVIVDDKKVLLNLAPQMGGQFPVDRTGTFISKLLGQVSNLNLVFSAIRSLGLKMKKTNDRVLGLEEALELVDSSLAAHEGLDDREVELSIIETELEAVSQVENLRDRLLGAQKARDDLADLRSAQASREALLGQLKGQLEACKEAAGHRDRVKKARASHRALKKAQVTQDPDPLRASLILVEKATADLEVLRKASVIRKDLGAAKLGARSPEPLLAALLEVDRLAGSVVQLKAKREVLQVAAEAVLDAKKKSERLDSMCTKVRDELHTHVNSMSHCPLVDQPWKDGCRETLIQIGTRRGSA